MQRLQELDGQNLSTASSSTGGETKDDELDDEAEREAEHWFRNEEDMTALVLERMEAEQRLSAREVEVEAELEEVEAQLEEDGVIADADLDAEADDYFAAEDALAGRNVSPDALRRARCAAESPDGWLHRGSSASADDAADAVVAAKIRQDVARGLGPRDSRAGSPRASPSAATTSSRARRRIHAYFHAAVLQSSASMHASAGAVGTRGGGSRWLSSATWRRRSSSTLLHTAATTTTRSIRRLDGEAGPMWFRRRRPPARAPRLPRTRRAARRPWAAARAARRAAFARRCLKR